MDYKTFCIIALVITGISILFVVVRLFFWKKFRNVKLFSNETVFSFIKYFLPFVNIYIVFVALLTFCFGKGFEGVDLKLDSDIYILSFFETFEAVKMKVNFDIIRHVLDDKILLISSAVSYVWSILLFYASIFTLIFKKISNKASVWIKLRNGCDILIGIEDYDIYTKDNKDVIVWLPHEISKEQENELLLKGTPIIKEDFTAENIYKVLKRTSYINGKNYYNFICFGAEEENFHYISAFKAFLDKSSPRKAKNKGKESTFLDHKAFNIYIEVNIDNLLSIQNKVLSDSEYAPFIHIINRYELIAQRFNYEYPITKCLPEGFLDTDRAIIKNDKEINVVYIGFGKVSQELYRISTINDVLPTFGYSKKYGKNRYSAFNINYHAFDDDTISEYENDFVVNDKNSMFYYERYRNLYKQLTNSLTIVSNFILTLAGFENEFLTMKKKNLYKDIDFNKFKDNIVASICDSKNFPRISNNLEDEYQCPTDEKEIIDELYKKLIDMYNSLAKEYKDQIINRVNESKANCHLEFDVLKKKLIEKINNYSDEFPSIKCHKENVYSEQGFKSLIDIIDGSNQNNDNSYTSVIISLGDDMKNIDYSIKLATLLKQHSVKNYKIFVRIKNYDEDKSTLLKEDNVIFFGNCNEIINRDSIVNKEFYYLAQTLHSSYKIKRLDETGWYGQKAIKQKCNFYLALNMRVKLNLIGYDHFYFSSKKDKRIPKEYESVTLDEVKGCLEPVTEEFKKLKEKVEFSDLVNTTYRDGVDLVSLERELKKLYEFDTFDDIYSSNLTDKSVRAYSLAYQEHSRWNRFYFMHGYIPMDFEEIKVKNPIELDVHKENHTTKKHGCLLDYYALDKYHDYVVDLIVKGACNIENKQLSDVEIADMKAKKLAELNKEYGIRLDFDDEHKPFELILNEEKKVDNIYKLASPTFARFIIGKYPEKSTEFFRYDKAFYINRIDDDLIQKYNPNDMIKDLKKTLYKDTLKKYISKVLEHDQKIKDSNSTNNMLPKDVREFLGYIDEYLKSIAKVSIEGYDLSDNIIKPSIKMLFDTYSYDYQIPENLEKIFYSKTYDVEQVRKAILTSIINNQECYVSDCAIKSKPDNRFNLIKKKTSEESGKEKKEGK